MITKRIKTGVPGLDSLLQGGFIQGSVYMLSGSTGTGKTIFCSQYLWEGLKRGEPCVYITLEEDPTDIKDDVMNFGWDFEKYEKKGLFRILYHDPAQINNIGAVILSELGSLKARRLVLDSVSVMGLTIGDVSQVRRRLFGIVNTMKTHDGCTGIITTEIPEESKVLSRFGVAEYIVDGIIVLNYLGIGEEYSRSLTIRKMRRTDHGKDVYPFEITDNGIVVKKPEV